MLPTKLDLLNVHFSSWKFGDICVCLSTCILSLSLASRRIVGIRGTNFRSSQSHCCCDECFGKICSNCTERACRIWSGKRTNGYSLPPHMNTLQAFKSTFFL